MLILKHLKTTCFVAAASTILLATGCRSDDNQRAESDASHSQAEVSETARLEQTQMAAGQRAECTLFEDHFDGPTLSSLGAAALDLTLADTRSCNPLVIYLSVPEDNYAQDRRLAIGRYLEDKGGLKPEQIEFRIGPNPNNFHAVDMQLTYTPRTDTTLDGGGAASASSAASK